MKVNKTIETEEGGVKFEGELTPEELDVIIGVGLNYLFKQGAIPFKVLDDKSIGNLVKGSEQQQ